MNPVYLDALTAYDCELVRQWRNAQPYGLRTSMPLTIEQQSAFFRDVVSNRQSPHRYYAIRRGQRDGQPNTSHVFVGMGGLTNISWENGTAEISLVIGPEHQGQGHGRAAVRELLREAFGRLRLSNVFGECYEIPGSTAPLFWRRIVKADEGYGFLLPARKFHGGQHVDSYYFGWLLPVLPRVR